MSVLNQNNSEMQNGIAVAESCVFYGTGSLKPQIKYKNITTWKRKESITYWSGNVLLKDGAEGSYSNGNIVDRGFENFHHGTRKFNMLAENSADNYAGYSPSLF